MNQQYAVIGCETTGIFAERGDRILEIAVVLLDASGAVQDTWSTLLNPGPELGPTHIHGVRRQHVLQAPRFREIAPYFAQLLAGRVLVSHRAAFTLTFLRSEFERAGLANQVTKIESMCTMRLCHEVDASTGRSLVDCGQALGLRLRRAHEALADANAAAQIFRVLLEQYPARVRKQRAHPFTLKRGALAEPVTEPAVRVRPDMERLPESFLGRVAPTARPWHTAGLDPIHELEYLAVLDLALSDGFLDINEADNLHLLADHFGFELRNREVLHRKYFEGVVAEAWADNVLSDDEIRQVRAVGIMLSVPQDIITRSLESAR
ncbi:hypothetical protein JT358_10495 [Micrococcales bacterium 31B]|nr:hypothetical protein [Micrococcales bacterium 31B]